MCIFFVLVVVAISNTYKWIVCGNQSISIIMPKTIYTGSDLYVSILAYDNGKKLETESKVKLLNEDGKVVEGIQVSYEKNYAIIKAPELEEGRYTVEAKVKSKAGIDTVRETINITDFLKENSIITLDKGVYKSRRYLEL